MIVDDFRAYKNIKLEQVISYIRKNDFGKDCYFLKLVYSAEGPDGFYEVIFPKVKLPFSHTLIPRITTDIYRGSTIRMDTYGFNNEALLLKGEGIVVNYLGQECKYEDAEYVLVKTKEHPAKEMTLSEIEEKLGYKVKIVNDART